MFFIYIFISTGDAVDFDTSKLVIEKTTKGERLILKAKISKADVSSFSSYTFRARCSNENGEVSRDLVIKTAGPPENCEHEKYFFVMEIVNK